MRFILLILAVAWVWACGKGHTIVGERMKLSEAFIITIKYNKKKIIKDFYKKDVVAPLANIKTSLSSTVRSAATSLKDYKKKINEDGLKNTITNTSKNAYKSAISKVKSIPASVVALEDTPKRLKDGVQVFIDQAQKDFRAKKSDKEKTYYVLTILSYTTVFLASAYGGYSLPDKDIALFGIGGHRNFFTHSVVPALLVALLVKFMIRVIDEIFIKTKNAGRRALAVIKNHLMLIIGGFSTGVAVHLLEDGILEPSGTIRGPGFNTFISGTTLDDQAYLVVNGLFSTIFGKKAVSGMISR
ncbi:MAG: hypothetical protein OYH77_02220 [Pseudomonadota bacterium]|nr:hypothetical protein [Pseudomonadota bacterium]